MISLADGIHRTAASGRRWLRSSSTAALVVRKTKLVTVGDRALQIAGSRVCGTICLLMPHLPQRCLLSIHDFKTHLFLGKTRFALLVWSVGRRRRRCRRRRSQQREAVEYLENGLT